MTVIQDHAGTDATGAVATPGSPIDAVRAFGMMLGGPILLAGGAIVGLVRLVRAIAHRRRPPVSAAATGVAVAVYAWWLRPWMLGWGSTAEEQGRALPGDELIPDPASQSTRAVTIDAPVAGVWPWLAQLGQDRGGFYSYTWLENLAGCRMRNADSIHPEWQHRAVGDTVLLHPASGLTVTRFEPGRMLALEGWGAFVVEPAGEGHTRLLARARTPRSLAKRAMGLLVEIPHFIMERRMLLGIKERAEGPASGRPDAASGR